jgi:hypothetical protein
MPAVLLCGLLLGGCAGTEDASLPSGTTRTYGYDAALYRVEVEEHVRDGTCRRRAIVFTAHEAPTRARRVDRARAVDRQCNAQSVRGFDQFEIVRSPSQKERYQYVAQYQRRVDRGLWAAYQAALRHGERPAEAP